MLANFGWKAALAVIVNATLATLAVSNHIDRVALTSGAPTQTKAVPIPVVAIHLATLAAIVMLAHHPVAFLGLFLLFLGFTQAYERHQSSLIIKEALLVGVFLAGLVVLRDMQRWWLQPIVSSLEPIALFFGSLALTAITDNAALTYLGSLIYAIVGPSRLYSKPVSKGFKLTESRKREPCMLNFRTNRV